MPVVRLDAQDLCRLIGRRIPTQRLAQRLPMLGGDLDKVEGDEITIEFFPNRPDLLSVEGVARAARAFFDVKPGLASYPVAEGAEEVRIEPSVARIRPHVAFARVDGLSLDAARLQDVIDLQERLTLGFGRRRKKVAIGIHDAKDVAAPYTYRAVAPDEARFVPLGGGRAMTAAQILKRHEKGKAYGHLLQGLSKVPIIEDKDGHVLSMPPIINGVRTQLTTATRDVLVDVTGLDRAAVLGALNIVVTSLAERGGNVKSLLHRQGKGRPWRAPDLTPARWRFDPSYAETLLGVKLPAAKLRTCLERMAHRVRKGTSPKAVAVDVGAWRLDLIHAVDLVEDVAIGWGFDAFESELPQRALFGSQRPSMRTAQRARTILLGHGFTEVVTLTLAGARDHLEPSDASARGVVRVANPVTQEQAVLRDRLYPSLLALLRTNRQNPLPQSVFEVGTVVPPVRDGQAPRNQLRAAAVRVASRATYSEAKSVAEAFLRDAGIKARFMPGRVHGLVDGRTAILEAEDGEAGFLGEVHPATLEAFELEAPAYCLEVILDRAPATP